MNYMSIEAYTTNGYTIKISDERAGGHDAADFSVYDRCGKLVDEGWITISKNGIARIERIK